VVAAPPARMPTLSTQKDVWLGIDSRPDETVRARLVQRLQYCRPRLDALFYKIPRPTSGCVSQMGYRRVLDSRSQRDALTRFRPRTTESLRGCGKRRLATRYDPQWVAKGERATGARHGRT